MITCSSLELKKPEKPPVFKSKSTYYNPVTKKWQAGDFMLHRNHLEFITENSDEETKNPFHLSLPLSTISSIEKRKSSFVFDAVMLRVGSETHWFSSFPNRNAVYNNLELFWRDNLMVKSFNIKQNSNGRDSPQNSSLGKELLGVLYDSEKHLVGAASALQEQGKQLHEAEEILNDMNGDLSKVEKQLNSLNFWTGASLNNGSVVEEATKVEEKKDVRKRKYNVTFSAEKAFDCYDWEKGVLVITNDITLLDDKDNIRFSFPSTELKLVKVMSPWELCIIKENGRETLCYVMCPMLSRVLRLFAAIPSIKDKVVYNDDESDTIMTNSSSCSSSLSLASASSTPSSPNVCWTLPDLPLLCEQVEKVRGSGYLTDEEIEEISSKLTDLHTLASEVEKEKQAQLERINTLINDTEKTDTRLNADTKKIRQLI